MRIPMLWRHFCKNIAKNGDYVYNYCNNPFNKFHWYCTHWYMYFFSKIEQGCLMIMIPQSITIF